MSYDISLLDEYTEEEIYSINMTFNVQPMLAEAAMDLKGWDGGVSSYLVTYLRATILYMEDDPERFKALAPSNGWGSYEQCLDFLRTLLQVCIANPRATIRVLS